MSTMQYNIIVAITVVAVLSLVLNFGLWWDSRGYEQNVEYYEEAVREANDLAWAWREEAETLERLLDEWVDSHDQLLREVSDTYFEMDTLRQEITDMNRLLDAMASHPATSIYFAELTQDSNPPF